MLDRTIAIARDYLANLEDRHVGPRASAEQLRSALDLPLPDSGEDPETVIEELTRSMDRGLVASAGPRYFGFVIGGSVPAALAADWLTSTWDQNAAIYAAAPRPVSPRMSALDGWSSSSASRGAPPSAS